VGGVGGGGSAQARTGSGAVPLSLRRAIGAPGVHRRWSPAHSLLLEGTGAPFTHPVRLQAEFFFSRGPHGQRYAEYSRKLSFLCLSFSSRSFQLL